MPAKSIQRKFLYLYMKNNDTFSPQADEIAHVIGGNISHIRGTPSQVFLAAKELGSASVIPFTLIATTVSTDTFVLNPTNPSTDYAEEDTSDSNQVWFDDRADLTFSGAATAVFIALVEIVKIDPYTGMPLT